MPSGLEDRIHQLCAQAVAAKNEAELQFILPESFEKLSEITFATAAHRRLR